MTLSLSQRLPATPPDEGELVARIGSGHPEALSAAYHTYAAGLLRLATRLMGSASDAEDVVQDLFVGLPEALGGYKERGHFLPWLKRGLVRLTLTRLRKRRNRRETDLKFAGGVVDRSVGAAAGLARALDQLTQEQRTIVVLKAIEGYSHNEIADLLRIRRNTSEVRYHRALLRLRELLEAP
jgi:RNA polymerase sigma-70 factor, ECF subfamily